MNDMTAAKHAAARAAVAHVTPGMLLGIGSGSTVHALIEELGKTILGVRCVPASCESADACRNAGIPLEELGKSMLDLVIDGADVIDNDGHVLKGLGGALVREKILAQAARKWILIVDETKLVDPLGGTVPVELLPYGMQHTKGRIEECVQVESTLRERGGEPFVTDNGNYILDVPIPRIEDPERLDRILVSIAGVVGTGLFVNLHPHVVVSAVNGVTREWDCP
ncbi:MAG: ribose-5-phosphate isomerase RpiA [Candidatus Dormibacteria bacterium]